MDPLSIIASTIAIVGVVASSSKAIQNIKGLPSEFREVNQSLPLVQDTLVLARDRLQDAGGVALDESSKNAIEPVLSGCETKARMLQEIFDKIEKGAKEAGGSGLELYRTALLRLGKAHRVETLLRDIIKSLDLLATNQFFRASIKRGKLIDAGDELSGLQSSVPDSEFESSGNVQNIAEGGTGQQTNIYGQGHNISSGSGKQFNAHIMNFINNIKGGRNPPFDLRTLHTSPYLERKNNISDRVPGTCEWFVGHEHFRRWKESKTSSLLWVSANPGCGKTVLSKHLVEHELRTTESRVTCYFFFKDDFEDQRNGKSAISCILHQLFTQRDTVLSPKIRKRLETHATHLTSSFDELWEILVMTAQDNNSIEIVCVLDALDECEEQGRNALALALRRFYESSASANLKFLVTGRPIENVTYIFRDLTASSMPVIHLEGEAPKELEMIAQEIKIYTRHRVRQIRQSLHLSADEEILLLRQLQGVQNQTYLWLYLTLRSIEDDLTITKAKIREVTSALPRSVNDAYEKMLSQSQDPANTRKVLHLVVAATRPLTLAEMDVALALHPHHKSHNALGERPPPQRLKKQIMNLCGYFVTITDSKIYLLHQTAKEFLVAKAGRIASSQLKWESSLRPQDSHGILSQICIQYILISELSGQTNLDDLKTRKDQVAQTVFLDYSLKNWAIHTRVADIEDPKVMESLRRLCTTETGTCPIWFGVHMSEHPHHSAEQPNDFTTLMIASVLGLDQFVKHLLEKDRAQVNYKDAWGRTALWLASSHGFDGVVRLLLKGPKFRLTEVRSWKGARIDAKSTHRRTPLMRAAIGGHETVLKLLLDNGAAVNAKDIDGQSALAFASEGGHEACARLLLKRGAKIEDADFEWPPLYLAAAEGFESITQVLLNAGANINVKARNGETPLMGACRHGFEVVVLLLLNAAANKEIRDNRGRTALFYAAGCSADAADEASLRAYRNIVNLLIKFGARVDVADKDGNTPLMFMEANWGKKLEEVAEPVRYKKLRGLVANYLPVVPVRLKKLHGLLVGHGSTWGYILAAAVAVLTVLCVTMLDDLWPTLENDDIWHTMLVGVREVLGLVCFVVISGALFIALLTYTAWSGKNMKVGVNERRGRPVIRFLFFLIGPACLAAVIAYNYYPRRVVVDGSLGDLTSHHQGPGKLGETD